MGQAAKDEFAGATAGVAGALYLVVIAAGLFAEIGVRGALIAPGDPAATLSAIAAHETLWRLGLASDLVAALAYAGVAVLLYELLSAVSRPLSFAAAAFGLLGTAIMAASLAGHYAPLILLAPTGPRMAPAEASALVLVALRLHAATYQVSMLFFAVHLAGMGALITRSRLLPHWLGWLLLAGGLCNGLDGLATFAAPSLAARLEPLISVPGPLAELALALGLSAIGIRGALWRGRLHTSDGMRIIDVKP